MAEITIGTKECCDGIEGLWAEMSERATLAPIDPEALEKLWALTRFFNCNCTKCPRCPDVNPDVKQRKE